MLQLSNTENDGNASENVVEDVTDLEMRLSVVT